MAKYQIILESHRNLPDDEFRRDIESACVLHEYEILEARNLDGIRDEVWQTPKPAAKKSGFEDLL